MMEFYVQEAAAVSYIQQVENEMFDRVTVTARSFTAVLQKAAYLKAANMPPKAWYVIFSA